MHKNHAGYLIGILFLLITQSSCANRGLQSNLQAPLDSLFGSMFRPDEPGAIVLVAKGDSVVYCEGFGLANLADRTPINDTTLINICSISKQFSAVALLKL